MKVMLLDTDVLQAQIIETPGGLKAWRKLIKCKLIDITRRKIGGHCYDIICDDEGLYIDEPKATVLDTNHDITIAGNIVICNYDGQGGEASLTDEDIQRITANLVVLREYMPPEGKEPQSWLAIDNTDYC